MGREHWGLLAIRKKVSSVREGSVKEIWAGSWAQDPATLSETHSLSSPSREGGLPHVMSLKESQNLVCTKVTWQNFTEMQIDSQTLSQRSVAGKYMLTTIIFNDDYIEFWWRWSRDHHTLIRLPSPSHQRYNLVFLGSSLSRILSLCHLVSDLSVPQFLHL